MLTAAHCASAGDAGSIQVLVGAGWSFDAVCGLTIEQLRLFIGAIERQAKERRLGDAIAARMAQADGPKWKTYVKELRSGR